MIKSIPVFLSLLFTYVICQSQDSIRYRVIFIGDAGEINPKQQTIIPDAAKHIITGKTTVMYLGDNIYPHGMGLVGSDEEETSKKILQSQFVPMRSKGAPVYFIPGNHDWDRMGKQGLAKIKEQWGYLNAQQDSLLKLVPANGCPGPVEINVSDSLTIIAFDSEWWLFPYNKENAEADCDCNTEKEVIDKMEGLLYKNRFKVILLASHHPFQSEGIHGGKYSLKDHVFPFTALNKSLYIPLPIIGSLYPLLRSSVFMSPEDLKHPLYKNMIKQIDHVYEGFPNLIHVAGHEHGLQLIKGKQVQIVSGAGAKNTFAKKGRNSLFADATQGFVTVDLLAGNETRITFYTYDGKVVTDAFAYTQPYKNIQYLIDSAKATTINTDSFVIQANARYANSGNWHKKIFGENYRKEWAAKTTVPVIRISEFKGGLTPIERGGGMQSVSLRLADKSGKEWVIRSVNKNPDPLLPEELRQTFARDFLDDAMSAQHPYSALIVPPIADAVNVPHSNPVIGIIASDTALGVYDHLFANTLCLVEEREPLGKSDNTLKMVKNLDKDNENSFKAKEFLRARILDMLLGDWDRHADQWRWKNENGSDEKEKLYIAVPRDRDQVLHVTQGALPRTASRPWVLPTLQNFDGEIKYPRYSLFKTNFLNARPEFQFSYDQWMKIANDFVKDVTDDTLEAALKRLPASAYNLRHDELLAKLKQRRDNIPAAIDKYYRFASKIVDIHTSDKNEVVEINDATGNALNITISRMNKEGVIKDKLMDKTYDPALTKEIRIYTGDGNDSVVVNNKSSSIRLRIIGGEGEKAYNIIAADKKIRLYDKDSIASYYGDIKRLRKHLSGDSTNTAFVPVNLYNSTMPLITGGFNLDDGLLLGGGFRHIQQEGFRKKPYSNVQQLLVSVAIATGAFKISYKGDWRHALGKADFILTARALAPNNTENFFGVGNNTEFDKTGDFKKYYRTRFSLYYVDPAVKWHSGKTSIFSIGPSLQYYHFNEDDNEGRFITNTSLIHSYDSATIAKDKMFTGIVMNYMKDNRNSKILPSSGGYFSVKIQGYTGLNSYSKSFLQIIPEIAFYKSVGRESNIVIADRIGGGISAGKTTFYQSLFLGGQENLLGFRQYRFAGEQMLYNNFEVRIKLAQVGSYILPGQLGLVGFYDVGKVWADGYNSSTIHQGVGGGFYYAPAQIAVVQVVIGSSKEGILPYITMGFRF
ncbi:MAG: BamA/TamA family outer membrane protein [Bacteroidota bacterium]